MPLGRRRPSCRPRGPAQQSAWRRPAGSPRLLGATFLVVVVTSLVGGVLLSSAVGSRRVRGPRGGIQEPRSPARGRGPRPRDGHRHRRARGPALRGARRGGPDARPHRVSAVAHRGDADGGQPPGRALARPARAGVRDGRPDSSSQVLGETIYEGIVRNAYSIHMLFYCAGGLLWYGLFYRSGYLPRAIPLFGLVAVILALGGTVLSSWGRACRSWCSCRSSRSSCSSVAGCCCGASGPMPWPPPGSDLPRPNPEARSWSTAAGLGEREGGPWPGPASSSSGDGGQRRGSGDWAARRCRRGPSARRGRRQWRGARRVPCQRRASTGTSDAGAGPPNPPRPRARTRRIPSPLTCQE